ncbi:Cell envelope-associated transcriptional attenuator LytR-CpsA-Psr, subfamily M [Cyanobacterium sp. HL-69]|uniref:LCP family protein n=1 Tax=Cyanobacterium sp. HL-69 TaxID=2054282 RepID=UPI000CA3C126|nr:Cell envelope-associated transcriptional attenuator LytR-CpsA-Psr, subfamily M [Cyanobacterium sp. HL-69]
MARRKKKSPVIKGIVWGSVLILTAGASAMVGMSVALNGELPFDMEAIWQKIDGVRQAGLSALWQRKLERPVNILVMGVDIQPGVDANSDQRFSARSDTMLLVRLDPHSNSLNMLSIPRDTRVRLPNGNWDKVNAANAIGGIDLTKRVLQNNFNNIPIDKYVRITTESFKELVDAVGGVDVYVPMDMEYSDHTQGLYINLKEGQQVLNGDQAEQFVRYRGDNLGDIGRVKRQQIILQAIKNKLQSPMVIIRLPQILKVVDKNVDTDLTNGEIITLMSFAKGLEQNGFNTTLLPGRPSQPWEYRLSYWLISENEKNQVIQPYLNR